MSKNHLDWICLKIASNVEIEKFIGNNNFGLLKIKMLIVSSRGLVATLDVKEKPCAIIQTDEKNGMLTKPIAHRYLVWEIKDLQAKK